MLLMVPPAYRSLIAYLNTSALVYFSSNFPLRIRIYDLMSSEPS